MKNFLLKMNHLEFIDHLQGHVKKVRLIMVSGEILFEMHVNDYTFITSKLIELI